MEIEPHPDNKHHLGDEKALVTFMSRQERNLFGFSAPSWSLERWRARVATIPDVPVPFPGLLRYPEDFPQTVKVSYALVGAVLVGLAHRASSHSATRQLEVEMRHTIDEHLDEKQAIAIAIAEDELLSRAIRQH